MNKKEERVFTLLTEDGELCYSGGQLLWKAIQTPDFREEAWQNIRTFRRGREEKKCHVRGLLEHAWSGESLAAAKLLAEAVEKILTLEESLGGLLAAGNGKAPEAAVTSMELVLLGLEELKKIFGYSRTLREDYMKAEARHQKLSNYEERNSHVILSGLKVLYGENNPMQALFWKDGLGKTGEILEASLEAASLFQQLTEDHL